MRARRQKGLSLIEALLAAAVFLMIVIGVLPLFTRATVQNVAGRESTDVTNQARSHAEELLQLPFNSQPLTIQVGSANVLVEYLVEGSQIWETALPAGRLLWTRTTTIRQYSVSALRDGVLDTTEALPAGTPPENIHLKEIEVLMQSGRAPAAVFGPAKQVTIRVLKSK